MEKSEYKALADALKKLSVSVSYDTEVKDACEKLIVYCDYRSRPHIIPLIKVLRAEMPWIGLKEAKEICEKIISENS